RCADLMQSPCTDVTKLQNPPLYEFVLRVQIPLIRDRRGQLRSHTEGHLRNIRTERLRCAVARGTDPAANPVGLRRSCVRIGDAGEIGRASCRERGEVTVG